MPRPRKHSDAELVAAAARTIAAQGPAGMTLADVAAEAGVSAATLVQRFGSKRELLLAVAASGPVSVADAFAAARRGRRSALSALEHALASLAATVGEPDEVANHLAFLALDLTDPAFRELAARDVQAIREEVLALLHEAAAAGELDAGGLAPLADALHAVYHGTLLLWAIDRDGAADRRVRRAVRAVLRR